MARRKPADAAVPIGLQVSEADAAGIDQVLTRPEFAGWTRAEWCREIVRTALRYYTGGPPAADPGPSREPARPAAQPAPAGRQPAPVPARSQATVGTAVAADEPTAGGAGAAGPVLPAASDAGPGSQEVPGPSARGECPHPADARDYERGVCAACGAIIWD